MKANKKKAFLDIYSGSPWQAKQIMSKLKEANVNAHVKEEISKKVATNPTIHLNGFCMKIVVSHEHYVNAMKIVHDYTNN